MRADIAAKNANFVQYGSMNVAALPLIDPAVRADPGIYPPAEVRAKLRPTLARSAAQTRIENRIWTRFRTGH